MLEHYGFNFTLLVAEFMETIQQIFPIKKCVLLIQMRQKHQLGILKLCQDFLKFQLCWRYFGDTKPTLSISLSLFLSLSLTLSETDMLTLAALTKALKKFFYCIKSNFLNGCHNPQFFQPSQITLETMRRQTTHVFLGCP